MMGLGRLLRGSQRGRRAPERESAARAKRARDHLARKRERDRQRLARDRQRQEVRAGRRRLLRVATPLLCLAAAALGSQLSTPLVERLWLGTKPLERIAVQGLERLRPERIAAGASLLAGQPIAAIDPAAARATIAAEPWIESAQVLRLPTGTLVVRVVERQAIARWQVEQRTELVDHRGGRFAGSIAPAGPLPLVRGEAEAGVNLPADAITILRELTRYAVLAQNPSGLTLHLPLAATAPNHERPRNAQGFVLEIGDDGPRALLGRRLLPQRVARLASLLDHEEGAARAARLIDLRFGDRAVLRTEPAPG
jgi:cell division protein FtsQ